MNVSGSQNGETSDAHDEKLAMVLAEVTDLAMRGEPVRIETYCDLHPDVARELRQLWATAQVAELAGSRTTSFSSSATARSIDVIELPSKFGDYELLEELGRGGMGIVYRARQKSLNRIVAIKMILRGELASEQDRERFESEARSVAKLQHPNIVPVYEIGETNGRAYFCMKYIEGQTLSQKLMSGVLDQRAAAALLAKVSRAIHYAHTQGVLHRDLKPSNILIDQDGEPHVSDFGLAKRITDASTITKTGAAIGTPSYMAPEQAVGARGTVGPASDVYGLGCILYHTLVGRPPFQAATAVDTLLMVLDQEPIPPRMLSRNVDRSLEMIALKCLQKPIDLRYDSAESLARDLEAFLKDEPMSATSGLFTQFMSRMFRETHHAAVLENWGLLWMWHSLVLLVACFATQFMQWSGVVDRWNYMLLWTAGLGTWAIVFWALRRRMGPVTFVERQIAHIWLGSMICIAALFPLEYWLGLPVLALSPVLGLINGMAFLVKAGILSGYFYIQATALFLAAGAMAMWPEISHIVFGVVAAASFFVPGLHYYRQRLFKSLQNLPGGFFKRDAGHTETT